ncbi:N-acetylmuramidase domain-containing protein [Cyclobacterium jeungdonense]|uniref:N-acetylmuramidase domain-containing protein n=2 Tax=Cyclobacterium jeungdonense TaxID=708087 RepID=A0ABT8CB34_9BACT|nr:N-acetylmuramidase domain-containing protein [Cyclobacterium jeungdonense]MDN3690023.1 N-acetylmuramidase domain-containing protein [Cyclobacterium jeungdonense]
METADNNPETTKEKKKESSERKYVLLHLGSIFLIMIAVLVFIVPGMESTNYGIASGLVVVIALVFMYALLARYFSPKTKDRNPNFNPYHTFFFKGTVILSTLLVTFGILGAFFVYIEYNNLFQAVGLATSVIWIALFLIYFMWSVYHYNINYGLTDQDWQRIYDAKDRHSQGFPVKMAEMATPDHNPYRSQTFGLPPGTVRGMIAFTLLMGGMALLIVSFGTQYSGVDAALLSQQFEFFETAFLMMIAFYFGDKSLKYLQNRWTPKGTGEKQSQSDTEQSVTSSQSGKWSLSQPQSTLDIDENAFALDDSAFVARNLESENTSPLEDQRVSLSTSFDMPPENLQIQEEFVQIKDNTDSKILSDMDIRLALEELEQKEQVRISLPVIKAVIAVESAGRGHLADGRAKILFEGHKFWHWLEKFGKDPKALQAGKEHLIYEKWTRDHYLGGAREYERLEQAKRIDPKAAVYATSWGLFQILGENMEHHLKGRKYKNVEEFEARQHESEYFHFLDFLEFIKTKKVRGKTLLDYISEENQGNYDWESFAYGYNGSGYKVNKYHIKMKAHYDKFKKEQTWMA